MVGLGERRHTPLVLTVTSCDEWLDQGVSTPLQDPEGLEDGLTKPGSNSTARSWQQGVSGSEVDIGTQPPEPWVSGTTLTNSRM